MFKGLGNLASIMRNAQQLGGQMQEIQTQLKSQRATGQAGGGMIEVEVNGVGEVLRVRVDPQLVESGEREMIEDLLPAAINQAQVKARQLHTEAMQSLTDGLNLPGLDEALAKFTGGDPPPASS